MENYKEILRVCVNHLIDDDKNDRKSKGLGKTRNEKEGIEYRSFFDSFYTTVTNEFKTSVNNDMGRFPHPNQMSSSEYRDLVELRPHDTLDEFLLLPHAIAKALDDKTNHRGGYADIAKVCNLFALSRVLVYAKLEEQEPKSGYSEVLKATLPLIRGLKDLCILDAFFSKGGINTGDFIYWLIYDDSKDELNFDILPDLARAIKWNTGNYSTLRNYIVGYWLYKKLNPADAVQYFNNEMLPGISREFGTVK